MTYFGSAIVAWAGNGALCSKKWLWWYTMAAEWMRVRLNRELYIYISSNNIRRLLSCLFTCAHGLLHTPEMPRWVLFATNNPASGGVWSPARLCDDTRRSVAGRRCCRRVHYEFHTFDDSLTDEKTEPFQCGWEDGVCKASARQHSPTECYVTQVTADCVCQVHTQTYIYSCIKHMDSVCMRRLFEYPLDRFRRNEQSLNGVEVQLCAASGRGRLDCACSEPTHHTMVQST